MIFDQLDYRNILRLSFGKRQQRNARYSLRAFARDLNLSPSRLSEVINGGHKLSTATAQDVAKRLGLSDSEQSYFSDLVAAEATKGDPKNHTILDRIERVRQDTVGETLSVERFEMVANWYHFGILELLKLKAFRPTVANIAAAFGLAKSDVTAAISRLCKLGFMKRAGTSLSLLKPRTNTKAETPSECIREFHRQVLEKSIDALFFQTMAERASGSMILAFDKDRLREAQDAMDCFRKDFAAQFAPKDADSVYCLSMQLFRLDGASNAAVPPPESQRV